MADEELWRALNESLTPVGSVEASGRGAYAPTTTLAEQLAMGKEIVGVTPDTIILAMPSPVTKGNQGPTFQEIGSTAPSSYSGMARSEYLPELRGVSGLRMYDKMKRGDARVRRSLRVAKIPVMAGRWYMNPATQSSRDVNVANFVWSNLTTWMSTSFPQFLWESMLMLDYGYYMFEKVFINGSDVTSDSAAKGKIVWKKFGPRHPADVLQWHWDDNGGPVSVDMPGLTGAQQIVNIPIEKLVVFSFDKEAGNLEGLSILRSAYKHWYYKDNLYKIDAIQKERHGIGVPIITLPPNFTNADKTLAGEIGRNLRTNEKAHIVLPPMWTIEFAKLEGQHVDALASAVHHSNEIDVNVLGDLFGVGEGTRTSSGDIADLFVKSTRFVADTFRDVINKYAIPQLVDMNWSRVGYPELRVRRIGETTDWRTLSFAVRNMVGAGVFQPDDPMEEWFREEMDLPPMDKATTRIVATPQMVTGVPEDDEDEAGDQGPPGQNNPKPGQGTVQTPSPPGAPAPSPAKAPRQSTAKGSRQGKTTGKRNTGRDASGG